ncbi:MAG: hypothetical protein ABJE95_06365 [Byssovorax sp.]
MKPSATPESIDLARYAEVTAYLREFPAEKKDEVLARLGLRRRIWEAESTRWAAARDAELASGKADLATRFGSALARARQRLAAQRPPLESIGPLPGPDELDPEAAPSSAMNTPLPGDELPMPVPVVHLMPGLDGPASNGPSLWSRHASFADRAPAPPIVQAPFAAPAVVKPATPDFNSTLPTNLDSPLAAPMPFHASQASPTQAYERAVAQAQAIQGPAESSREVKSLGSTVSLVNEVAAPPPLPPGVPDFTLQQYASFRVDLHTNPTNAPRILGLYRVSHEVRPLLDAYWKARFEADPLQRMMFARAFAAYSLWLKENSAGAPPAPAPAPAPPKVVESLSKRRS